MKKRALITGITGQDGSILSEILLDKGYEVHGIIRRHSVVEGQYFRLNYLNILDKVNLHYGDLLDKSSIDNTVKKTKPHELYHLAAQSQVGISFEIPEFTIKANTIGALNVLEAIREYQPDAHIYMAGSSEMYGNEIDDDGYQREDTPMHPVSPYGISKLFCYNLANHYRDTYNLFICSGILHNHESCLRGSNFVTKKITKAAVRIKKKIQENLKLGNIDSMRDWGHSSDYCKGMILMLNQKYPDNYVLSTGNSYSVRDFCKKVFEKLDLNYQDYLIIDKKFIRPHELKKLRGDSSKARQVLKWEPKISFDDLIEEMIDYEMKTIDRGQQYV